MSPPPDSPAGAPDDTHPPPGPAREPGPTTDPVQASEDGAAAGWSGGQEPPVSFAAVDDHPIVLEGLATALGQLPGLTLTATATSVAELLAGPGLEADVVLLDLDLGDGTDPAETIRRLIGLGRAVAVYSASADAETVRAALRAGAAAYVAKTDHLDDVARAVRATASGVGWISPPVAFMLLTDDAPDRPALSPQEKHALRLYAAGLSIRMVAEKMGVAPETAKQYIDRVRKKYRDVGRPASTKIDLLHRAEEDGHLLGSAKDSSTASS
ncbi:response regulator transcription factor [Frankia sp. CNm7]|uniref:Response regulator transcription factor n=1 Tax=Frankia nepalensis TaxID=1836974 RepID=A0A937RHE9_9ACTN|nr:response regulator transcription factor [Frankia nepalensis]MBL7496406.1 response regulator transcription factor [Frankia nepalensis]MBL7513776.1 response regulator transcription factor [Frankia nepalensis]MBL7519606.1 response regulator transcription factor [Frankia nepalensis]MBL7630192.1 response regulator transcription factor [Frankia nepalensis]